MIPNFWKNGDWKFFFIRITNSFLFKLIRLVNQHKDEALANKFIDLARIYARRPDLKDYLEEDKCHRNLNREI